MARQIEEIVLKISVDDSGAKGGLSGLGGATDNAGKKAKKLEKGFDNLKDSIKNAGTLPSNAFDSTALKNFRKEQNKTKKSTDRLRGGLRGMKSIIVALGLTKLAGEALDVAKQFDRIDNSLKTVTGSQAQANKEFKFLNTIADDLGVNLLTVADGYVKLLGATKGTPLAGKVTKDLAQGVFELSTAMGLAEGETSGIIRAVSQIASKGKLSSEELQQLAERGVPAFQLASKAIGVTTAELNKMLEQGKVLSSDFLPKFAKQLRTEFAGAADAASNSIQANSNRLKNEWARSIEGGGQALSKFIPLLTGTIGLINDFGTAVRESAEGTNLWLDELFGLEDQTSKAFTNAEQAQIKAASATRNLRREQKLATAEANKLAAEQQKIADAWEKVSGLSNLEFGFTLDKLTEDLIEKLGLTALEAEKLGPAIKEAFKEGADIENTSSSVLSIIKIWKKELNAVEINEEKLVNPFNEMLKKATLLKDALNFSKDLGLSAKEFQKIAGAIIKAREQGLSKEDIKAQILGLRDVGFFEEEKNKEKKSSVRSSGPATSAFQKGTAEASAFLQNNKVQLESLDVQKKIEKNTRNQSKVEFIAK